MVLKVSGFITLLALAVLFASQAQWLSGAEQFTQFVFKVGVVSSVVAAFALVFGW